MGKYRIPDVVRRYTDYDMIQKYTELPTFPDIRTRLLFTFLGTGPEGWERNEIFAMAASLAQLGLDIHDWVEDESKESESMEQLRSRQLRVLAGDYFSSRFYRLLAQAGQIQVSHYLAKAICEVNRLKMSLHKAKQELQLTAESYLEQTVQIRMRLFSVFTPWIHERYRNLWPELLRDFTMCELVMEELQNSESKGCFRYKWAFWHLLQTATREDRKQLEAMDCAQLQQSSLLTKYRVIPQLQRLLYSRVQLLMEKVESLASSELADSLMRVAEPFISLHPIAEQGGNPGWKLDAASKI